MFAQFDEDEKGTINIDEFIAALEGEHSFEDLEPL
jgi:Ca2+-binding EF-hand superfamily protein